MNYKKIFLIIGIFVLICVCFAGFKIKKVYDEYNENLNRRLAKVYYANQDIFAGDTIYVYMVNEKYINHSNLEDDYITNSDLMIGKCVRENIIIKENDILRNDFLENCE